MTSIFRDDLSLRQETTWDERCRDNLSIISFMAHDELTDAEVMALVRERTRQARVSRGWDTKKMADELGVSEAAYKKYEERKSSALPTKKIRRFCQLTNVDPVWLTASDLPRMRRQTRQG